MNASTKISTNFSNLVTKISTETVFMVLSTKISTNFLNLVTEISTGEPKGALVLKLAFLKKT